MKCFESPVVDIVSLEATDVIAESCDYETPETCISEG